MVRREKRLYVANLILKVDEATPSRQLWNIIKGIDTSLSGTARKTTLMTHTKGEEFMNYYFHGKSKKIQMPSTRTHETLEGYEMALKDNETLQALGKTKSYSAPRENQISYDILKQLPLGMQLKFSEMISRVFVTETIPSRWRITVIKPIPKNNAVPGLPNASRPIALMNVEIKLINTVVKNRLAEIADIGGLMPELSFGFRKHRSASTCVTYLINAIHEIKEHEEEAIVAFLDVKKAYDSVNTNKLLRILADLHIPRKLISWLYEYLRHRIMRLETEDGVIEEVVSEGLPQGCPVSPMYNFYTTALHDLNDDSCELVQFADDFAVIARGATLELAEQNLNHFLNKLASRLKDLDLEICPHKSAVIPFTGKRIDHLRLKIQGQRVEVVNTHLYLGFMLDRALRHRKHIGTITEKAREKLPLLKLLARKSGGANPETLLNVGNAVIRSRMEYGASSFGNAASTNFKKLQLLQNSYIRIAMKYLRSTPVHIMLAETSQLPMKLRIELLTKKELIRSVFHRTPLLHFISDTLSKEIPNGSYLSEMADKHADDIFQVHPSDKDIARETRMKYFFNFDLEDFVHPTLGEEKLMKKQHCNLIWQNLFREATHTKYKDHKMIFPNASKTPSGTALAVYDEYEQITKTESINNNYSITNAELRAIFKATEHIKEKQYKQTVIFTDSRSAYQSLMNRNTLLENFIIWDIHKEMKSMRKGAVQIQWIPSHMDIHGNEIADQAAVAKSSEKQTEHIGITQGDAIILCQKEVLNEWTKEYKLISNTKGRWHHKIMENPGRNCWSKDLILSSEQKKILNRIRSRHTCTKERRALWGLELDECCEMCIEREDLNHSLYHCPKYNNTRIKFNALEYMKPLEEIFLENCEESMKQICNFIKEALMRPMIKPYVVDEWFVLTGIGQGSRIQIKERGFRVIFVTGHSSDGIQAIR
ncbi:uncharacterized protein LOC131687396 [Topomyia yanbarensis]|uniref:uncharacterized protein LOC131687396 n=1 Tax=Topomyia yanbarensis TaxID=2498891 RepID=UPI00273A7529|nr:uncharacterized protein LOC131687396 [Topomyia yanbarensis]